ncbi:MAG: OmpA family protein [Desulfobacterales bacterium]|nr:OmpA family protein [Desulfobacterales bacterium]
MRKIFTFRLFSIVSIFLFPCTVMANDLIFPKTEAEVINALKMEDKTVEFQGVTYQSESHKIYKIINGKRYRVRGIQIVHTPILPKAGALINFEFNSTKIEADSYGTLHMFGKAFVEKLPTAVFIVAGHSDSDGPDDYNLELSKQRARAIANYLQKTFNIKANRLWVEGYGEKQPLHPNNTEKGRALNRRVEFIRVE